MRLPRSLAGVAPASGSAALRLLAWTLRIRCDEGSLGPRRPAGSPVIYAVWHGRVLLLPYLYGWTGARVLASRSRDGELVTRLIERFGLFAVRGSSSRGGAGALRVLERSLREGRDVVVVPDGPRGPREMVKPGVVALARRSGAPIVPIAVGASAEWRLGSWDEFRIPKPFARCLVRFGEPVQIPGDTAEGADEAARKEVEASLRSLCWRVDREVGR